MSNRKLIKGAKNDDFIKNAFENAAWLAESVVCGIDEVGRGCLAGPLVTAAVIIPPFQENSALKDSKEMSAQQRQEAFLWIQKHCWYNVGIVHNRIIDQRNIWQSTLICMKKAVMNLLAHCPYRPHSILVDAMPLSVADTSYADIPVHYFIKGEKKSTSIAAASIVAKVYRDTLMYHLDELFPHYYLQKHKGYATQMHRDSLQEEEHSIIHRVSFLKNSTKTQGG